jgi:hypothetical protein
MKCTDCVYNDYMAPYLMNHYLRTYLIKICFVLYYRRDHTFDVKTCFQQNRYVFDVIVTSCALFALNMGPYMALIVPSSFYGIDAGLHALSFSLGFNVHKLYLK